MEVYRGNFIVDFDGELGIVIRADDKRIAVLYARAEVNGELNYAIVRYAKADLKKYEFFIVANEAIPMDAYRRMISLWSEQLKKPGYAPYTPQHP